MASLFGQTRSTVIVATLSFVVLMSTDMSHAQTTEITSSGLGTEVSIPTTLPNGTINYDITGGSRPGNGPNLFHSFGEFSVATNNIANFLNETGMPTTNILSRVTGGNPSNIFGTLQTANFDAANLYLINPAGIIFGPTASLNVGGSFAASTADYLKMTDGAKFYANPAQTSVLSLSPVAAFGFLGPNPASITIQEGLLNVPPGQTLSLAGGDITMVGGAFTAPGGRINLASVASAGEVVPNPPGQSQALNVNSFTQLGRIQLSQGARINASEDNLPDTGAGGTVVIRSGRLTLDNSSIEVITLKTIVVGVPVAAVNINATRSVTLSNNSAIGTPTAFGRGGAITISTPFLEVNAATITANNFGGTVGGDIALDVGKLEVTSGGQITSFATLSGLAAGNVKVTATDSVVISGTSDHLASTISTVGGGSASSAGSINISAPDLTLANAGVITASVHGTGTGGNITINVAELTLTSVAKISSDSTSTASEAGNAGNITIQGITSPGSPATTVSLNNSAISTSIAGGNSSSMPAGIKIAAQTVNLANRSQINADTSGIAPAGNIIFHVDTLMVDDFLTTISSSSVRPFVFPLDLGKVGNAGAITIQGINGPGSPAANVSLNASSIATSSLNGSASNTAANIAITAQTLALTNSAGIQANTFGAAPAGNIALHVGTLMVGKSVISSTSSPFNHPFDLTAGNGGSITVEGITGPGSPAINVRLDNSQIRTSRLFGSTANTASDIAITAQTLALDNIAEIRADTEGEAPAGDITLNVGTLTASKSTISSSSNSLLVNRAGLGKEGNAGTITIQGTAGSGSPAANVNLDGGEITTVAFFGSAANTAANIVITAQTLAVNSELINANTFGAAPAGNIAFHVDTLTVGNSTISSTSVPLADQAAGNAGTITIQGLKGSSSPTANVSFNDSEILTFRIGGSAGDTASDIAFIAQTLALVNSSIQADTYGAAPAGNIAFHVGMLAAAGSTISSSSPGDGFQTDSSPGNAGKITVQGLNGSGSPAANVSLDNSTISTTIDQGSAANTPANIAISAHTMALANGTQIQADTNGGAPAGDIVLQGGTLTSDSSTISTRSTSTNPLITAGNAGNITLTSASNLTLTNSTVTTFAAQTSGGNITLTAPGMVLLRNSPLTSSVQGGRTTRGGDIIIDPQFVILQNSPISAKAFQGNGGNIRIDATRAVLVDPNSPLDASSTLGISGSVNINSPIQVLSGALVPLNLAYSQAGLSGDRCAADPTGQFSSFVQAGRDGVPQVPGALSPSPLSFLETLTSGSWGSQAPNWAAARLGLNFVSVDDSTLFRFRSACHS